MTTVSYCTRRQARRDLRGLPPGGRIDHEALRRNGPGPDDFLDARASYERAHLGRERTRPGSTFLFTATFPTVDLPARTDKPVLIDLPVLIVDDNEVNRRIFQELLTRWQMKPQAVDSGAAALTALAEAACQGHPFAFVLLDANMPEMDGFAVAERMMAHPELGGSTIMMLTSSGQFGDSTRCRELGIRAYLTKPIRHADLFNALCQTLRPQGPRRSADPAVDAHDASVVPARILLAEDNTVNQRVAVGLLTRRGHNVDVVSNGLEALAALVSGSYDVVLMDVQMPEMGGIEATRVIREREALTGRHSRIVAVTAHAMAGDRERFLGAGMDGYLSKPIDPTMLFAAVELQEPVRDRRPAEGPFPAGADLIMEALRRRLGSDELVVEVTEMFLVDCPARLAQIKAAVAARDRGAIRIAAHALKGAAGNFSASPAADCAGAPELMAADGVFDPIAADAACGRLEAESARLVAVLRASLLAPANGVEPPTREYVS